MVGLVRIEKYLLSASNNIHQVFIEKNPITRISISGIYQWPNNSNWCNGMTVKNRTFILNRSQIWNNKDQRMKITNKSVRQFQRISWTIFENGQPLEINGSSFNIENNLWFPLI
jgi:hypothetical protein